MAAGLLDLPSLLQQAAAARRTGAVIVVGQVSGQAEAQRRRLFLESGSLVAVGGNPLGGEELLLRACVWVGALSPGATIDDMSSLSRDALLDAMDAIFEEEMGVCLSFKDPEITFQEQLAKDPWEERQSAFSHSAATGGIILECLRRQDEAGSAARLLPPGQRILLTGTADDPLDGDEAMLCPGSGPWILSEILENPWMQPFRSQAAVHRLVQRQRLMIADVAHSLAVAETWRSGGRLQAAAEAFIAAISLGGPRRAMLQVADLYERLGELDKAAHWNLRAAEDGDPSDKVLALRNARRLGADPELVLSALVDVYTVLEEKDEAIEALQELAEFRAKAKRPEAAAAAVRQAQSIGADPVHSARALARFALQNGDENAAKLHLEQAARAAGASGRQAAEVEAWAHLTGLEPGRLDWARDYADALTAMGRNGEALVALRLARNAPAAGTSSELAADIDRRITVLDPDDHEAHDRLAAYLSSTRDRDGALTQFRAAAAAMDRAGDLQGLVQTLDRIVQLGGGQAQDLANLGAACVRAGLESRAVSYVCAGVDRFLTEGALAKARNLCAQALGKMPWSMQIRARFALIALRAGDETAAVELYRQAADLALGAADRTSAKHLLQELCSLRKDLLLPRIQLSELIRAMAGDRMAVAEARILDRLHKEIIRLALRQSNVGIAIDHSRKRVALGVDLDRARADLITLLMQTGHVDAAVHEGNLLVSDLIQRGEIAAAVPVIGQQLVADPENPVLAQALTEAAAWAGQARLARRAATHASCLTQETGDHGGLRRMLEVLRQLGESKDVIQMAHEYVAAGKRLVWAEIHAACARESRRLVAQHLTAPRVASGRLPTQRSGPLPSVGPRRPRDR